MNTALTVAASALARLEKSMAKTSLDDLVKARTRRSLLLVDCSSSMNNSLSTGERRIDALRKVVTTLRETHHVPVAAFGGRGIEVVDTVPNASGGTPMDRAIEFATQQGANHLVVVSDGEPNNESATFDAADRFGGAIDTFFIGDGRSHGSKFAAELARRTGGQFNLTDLGEQKQLAGMATKITLLLGDGSELLS